MKEDVAREWWMFWQDKHKVVPIQRNTKRERMKKLNNKIESEVVIRRWMSREGVFFAWEKFAFLCKLEGCSVEIFKKCLQIFTECHWMKRPFSKIPCRYMKVNHSRDGKKQITSCFTSKITVPQWHFQVAILHLLLYCIYFSDIPGVSNSF